jgi:hypothetical protein
MQVDLPESLVKKLWDCAIPFVETTVPHVVEKLVLFYQQHQTGVGSEALSARVGNGVDETLRRLDPNRPPDLTHTSVRGLFGNERFADWNDLLRTAHVAAYKELKSFQKLQSVSQAQLRQGAHNAGGYRPLPGLDVSLQGVDANRAWARSFHLAKYLKVPIKAELSWRENPAGAFPGERGVFEWKP